MRISLSEHLLDYLRALSWLTGINLLAHDMRDAFGDELCRHYAVTVNVSLLLE